METKTKPGREIGPYQDLTFYRWGQVVFLGGNEQELVPGCTIYCCGEYPPMPVSEMALKPTPKLSQSNLESFLIFSNMMTKSRLNPHILRLHPNIEAELRLNPHILRLNPNVLAESRIHPNI